MPRRAAADNSWHGIVQRTLKRNEIRLVPYVPDRVLTPLIRGLHADPYVTPFPAAREEEAVGIVSGAWMGGLRGAVLMQTSGCATLANDTEGYKLQEFAAILSHPCGLCATSPDAWWTRFSFCEHREK